MAAGGGPGTGPPVPAGHVVTRRMSWLLAGFTALALAAALTLLGLSAGQLHAAQLGFEVILAAAILLYAGTGRLIVRESSRPGPAG